MAQDYTTRDQYGNIWAPEVDPAFDSDYRAKQILAKMDNEKKEADNFNAAANRIYGVGKKPLRDGNLGDINGIAESLGDFGTDTGITRNNYREDEWLDKLYDEQTRAQIGGVVAEILGSTFAYNQMKANEQGREPTTADIAMDMLSNTPAFPLTSAYDIYDDYLNEKDNPEVGQEQAIENAKVGAGLTAAFSALPFLKPMRKGIKQLITRRKKLPQ